MKRLFWLSVGYLGGLGSALWVRKRIRETVERYTSDWLRDEFTQRSKQLGDDVLHRAQDRSRQMASRAKTVASDVREAIRREFPSDERLAS